MVEQTPTPFQQVVPTRDSITMGAIQGLADGDLLPILEWQRETRLRVWLRDHSTNNDFLYDWLIDVSTMAHAAASASRTPRMVFSQKHCELVRQLLITSFVNDEWDAWDEHDASEAAARWTNLLVRQRYPWYICSLWWRYAATQDAAQMLVDAAVRHANFSVLHQLTHRKIIASVWDASVFRRVSPTSDDRAAMERFFGALEQPQHRRPFAEWRRNHVPLFPYAADCSMTMGTIVDAASRVNARKCLHALWAYDRAHAALWSTSSFVCACLHANAADLTDWVCEELRQSHERLANVCADTWWKWFSLLAPRSNQHDRCRVDPLQRARLIEDFMAFCHASTRPETWCDLMCVSPHDRPFLTILLCNAPNPDLLRQCHAWTVDAIAQLPPRHISRVSDHTSADDTSTLNSNATPTTFAWESVRANPDTWFGAVNAALVAPHSGWSPFANALRWSTVQGVMWCLVHGASIWDPHQCPASCGLDVVNDNVVSLALSNTDNNVARVVLSLVDRGWSQPTKRTAVLRWIQCDEMRSLAQAFTRIGIRNHRHALCKWRMLEPFMQTVTARDFADLVGAYLRSHHARTHQPRAAPLKNLWANPVLWAMMDRASKAITMDDVKLLLQDRMETQPECVVDTLTSWSTRFQLKWTSDAFTTLLIHRKCSPDIHSALLQLPNTVQQMRGWSHTAEALRVFLRAYLSQPLVANAVPAADPELTSPAEEHSSLVRRPPDEAHVEACAKFRTFVCVARDVWRWDLRHLLPRRESSYRLLLHSHHVCGAHRAFMQHHHRQAQLHAGLGVLMDEGVLPLILHRYDMAMHTYEPAPFQRRLHAYRFLRRWVRARTTRRRKEQEFHRSQLHVEIACRNLRLNAPFVWSSDNLTVDRALACT